MVDPAVVAAVQAYLEAVDRAGIPISFGVVYGSHARGTADTWSDIDVLVVSPQFDGPRQRADIALLWRYAARVDSRVEPVPCGSQQWESDDSSAIIEIARRSGQQIALPEAA